MLPHSADSNSRRDLGVGIGLRPPHYSEVLQQRPKLAWFEAISENYLTFDERGPGAALVSLEKIRADYEIVLHGVSLSIGSVDPISVNYLTHLKQLYDRIQPAWVSDHLCWTGVQDENLHDLLPLPYTEEALNHVCSRIQYVQERLGRRISIENVSSYLTYTHSTLSEWEFLREIAQRTGCGILLDVNNIYVSSINHGFSATEFLNAIPRSAVTQIHLAGHSKSGTLLVDTHDSPVCESVWQLYAETVRRFGSIPTLIEWDAELPTLGRLLQEADHAKKILEETLR